jgi:DNA polymerase-3 subunit delta'
MLSDIVGQDEAVKVLRRIVSGDLKNPLLLVGGEGIGRKASVKAAIREILVASRGLNSPEVTQYDLGTHPDVFLVEPEEGKDLGVESIREAISESYQYPVASPLRFFLVEGADHMTPAAANAILKTLEEPADFVRFFLLAESYDRVIPTIRSRCGRVDYRKLPESFVHSRMSKFERDSDKALVYARLSEGSIGKATRYWSTNRIVIRNKVMEILRLASVGDLPSAFGGIDELSKDLQFVLQCAIAIVHDLLLVLTIPERVINRDVTEDMTEIQSKAPAQKWSSLWGNLRTVWVDNESTHVNLAFQIKTALATTFSG